MSVIIPAVAFAATCLYKSVLSVVSPILWVPVRDLILVDNPETSIRLPTSNSCGSVKYANILLDFSSYLFKLLKLLI